MESYSRIRSVKLRRPTPDHPFGFSVRGGHEHGTGIFVSFVDPRSLAYRQGLKVGDQILRVNGFPVSAAVHHECLSLMKIRTSLHLKVRSVGMLPVKEKTGDPLSWKLVEEQPQALGDLPDHGSNNNRHQTVNSRMSDTSSQPDSRTDFHGLEAKVLIDISGQSGLGCCICKGPPERPGIFVQSTKSNGVAREAGLRPGDQVISCNGHSFLHIPFAEAVYYLKSSSQLKLRVLKGVASDLFPGESSGYNSSASSLNGDAQLSSNPPSESSISPAGHADILVHDHEQSSKRLSMVTEEIPSPDDSDRRSGNKKNLALDRNMEWDEVEQVWRKAEKETLVIEVKGEDPTDKIRSEEERLIEERRKLEETQRRLHQESLRLEEEKRLFEEEKRRSLKKSPSIVSNSSSSTTSGNSLAGALTQEILKRNERRENNPQGKEDERPKPGTVEQKRSLFTTQIDHEKRQQHEQLIEEFKRAHRKMFAHTISEESNKEDNSQDNSSASEPVRSRRIQKEIDHERQMVAQRVAGIVRQRQLRIERQHQEVEESAREVSKKGPRIIGKNPPPPPPPPPPADEEDGSSSSSSGNKAPGPMPPMPNPKFTNKPLAPTIPLSSIKTVIIEEKDSHSSLPVISRSSKGQAPPPPPPQRSAEVVTTNGLKHYDPNTTPPNSNTINSINPSILKSAPNTGVGPRERRPESPSPDYSNSPSPIPSPPRQRLRQIGVDMQSLESFRLKDPPRSVRKPPPVYFCETTQQLIQAHPNHPIAQGQGRLAAYPTVYSSRPGAIMVDPPVVPNDPKSNNNNLNNANKNSNNRSDHMLQRELLEDALARCNLVNGGDVSSNGQGKVTIVVGDPGGNGVNNRPMGNNHNNHSNHHSNNGMKPILKVGNGHGTSSTPKTISFGGKY